jgi:hypothetical protein
MPVTDFGLPLVTGSGEAFMFWMREARLRRTVAESRSVSLSPPFLMAVPTVFQSAASLLASLLPLPPGMLSGSMVIVSSQSRKV